MTVELEWDPIGFFLDTFRKKWPKVECVITLRADPEQMFHEGKKVLGITVFPDDQDEVPVIMLDSQDMTMSGIFDIMAHELAHVLAGNNDESANHGKVWADYYDQIHENYMASMECDHEEEQVEEDTGIPALSDGTHN